MDVFGRADDGSAVLVILSDRTQLPELDRRWPPIGLHRTQAAGRRSALDLVLRVPDAPDTQAWDRIESDLGLFTVERLDGLVAIHAAVLAVDDLLILLPGRSHTGKSTLSIALREAGAMLLSDEYALVDPRDGAVSGWPRPARVRVGSHDSRREPVSTHLPPMQVSLVALLRYDSSLDGCNPLELAPLSRADAVISVLDETVCAKSRPDESLDAALAVTARAVLKGRRAEAGAAARELLSSLRAGRHP